MKARILVVLLLAAVSGAVHAQAWPDRPVKFISSQAAGGGTDMIGRLVADQLSARIGQPVVYENRPGGGNVIGTQAAARSAPDGYTFFYASAAALVTDPHTYKSLPYDPVKAFDVDFEHCRSLLHDPGASGRAGEDAAGARRLRQGQSRQAADRDRRATALLRPDRGLDQQAGRDEHLLCAVRPDDAGHPGRDLRARSAHHSRGSGGARAHRRRQAQARWP